MRKGLVKVAPNALSVEIILVLLLSVEPELPSWGTSSYTKTLSVEDVETTRSDGQLPHVQ